MINAITKLKIKNFHSIKDEVDIDFTANDYTNTHHPERIFNYGNNIYNKIVAIYGANASGKTSILKAIALVSNVITNESKDSFPVSHRNLYANGNINTLIKIEFISMGKKYTYEVIFEHNKERNLSINNEILKLHNGNKFKVVLDRKKKILKDEKFKNIEILFEKIPFTKSIINEALTRDETSLYESISRFFSSIKITTNIQGPNSTSFEVTYSDMLTLGMFFSSPSDKDYLSEMFGSDTVKNLVDNKDFIKFSKNFMNAVGIDINNIKAKVKMDDNDSVKIKLTTFHDIDKKKPLEFNSESDGTKMLIDILLKIYMSKKGLSILLIDEFDSVLHPMLVPILNHLICESNIQIIYTTHNIYNMKYLYCDEVYLIDKNENHDTVVSSVNDNKDIDCFENIEVLYENEILGGLPKINLANGLSL